ncbi:MAG: ATP-dependent metallopeptidase FtsH/Yme1/Tma family protein, partial [Micromonosporaceae bacterium]
MERTRIFRRPVVWILLVIIGAVALSSLFTGGDDYTEVETSVALERLQQGGIESVVVEDREQVIKIDLAEPMTVNGTKTDKIRASFMESAGPVIDEQVRDAKAKGLITGTTDVKVSQESIWGTLLIYLIPVAILVILILFFMSQVQGGGSRVLNFGKSRAKQITKDMPKTTFADVAGADEAVEELQEIKDFLQNPA